VQADHFRGLTLFEVAAHGIANFVVKLRLGIGLREDRHSQGFNARQK
jgi:hypothetical protein